MNGNLIVDAGLCGAELTIEHFRDDVLNGLARRQKSVPCKYLYDEEGARLFEEICELGEYYPTRTEVRILKRNIGEMAAWVGPKCNLIEFGSGNSMKTRFLLSHLDHPARYIPIDVARAQLLETSTRLVNEFPGLEVAPICADYTNHFELPAFSSSSGRPIVFFPGSTIGNFEPEEAEGFLRRVAEMCGEEGGMLLGVDLKKDSAVLNPAYNDAEGVTAAFNLNLLVRANRELDANFDLACFRHHAFYNEYAGRIEMHLISRKRQNVSVCGEEFEFELGESILTEHSYKYTPQEFEELAVQAGFKVVRCWTDERQWFSLQFLTPLSRSL
ncbi:L-histidine N(alpha)-methyltransferase [Pedosphaera parvula]|uniref:Methyltransferase n=1 Tax=Pedosphaera parvula (strain Ellin514) TaxID=320771 RepID=B9XK61_PEDPL|nr:L-histidine N(alpha)-methyltransferase [Pedosphaera parvula]EEF59699.1 methyltransferase [Pedosphaera parvula Ellin514]